MDATPFLHIQFGFAVGSHILWSSFTFGIGLWRHVVPRYPTVWSGLSGGVASSWAGTGLLVILPIILDYLGHPCRAFRGKTVHEGDWRAPIRRTGREVSRSGASDRTCGSPTVDRLFTLSVAAAAFSRWEICHARD
jgi:hypothetical protein